jgi:hypothetical protein
MKHTERASAPHSRRSVAMLEDPLNDPRADPVLEAAMPGLIGWIAWGPVLPWRPSPQDPEHAVPDG